MAASGALAPRKEENVLIPGRGNKPADVLIPNWTKGLDTALDVTVVNSLRSDYVDQEAASPGYALVQAHKRKMAAIGEACKEQGIEFVPIPVEVLGGWSKEASRHISRLSRASAARSGKDDKEAQGHLFQKLGVLLQRGNAALLLNRAPNPTIHSNI